MVGRTHGPLGLSPMKVAILASEALWKAASRTGPETVWESKSSLAGGLS